jgi:hypothetical protein
MKHRDLYQEAMKVFWTELEHQGLAPCPFPGFGSSSSAEELRNRPLFPEVALLGMALDCSLAGKSAVIDREDGSSFVIYGTDVAERWIGADVFLQWPFIPLVVDTEGFTVGLTLGEGGRFALACVAKEALYDETPPRSPDLFDVIDGGIEALPQAMRRIVKEGGEMVLFDAL